MGDKLRIAATGVATFDWSLKIDHALVVAGRGEHFHDVSTFIDVVLLIDQGEFDFSLKWPDKEGIILALQELDVH